MNKASTPHHIVVIGASAGGMGALEELASQLHGQMNAAFFVVMHLSQKGIGNFLVQRLQKVTTLPCRLAEDGAPIEKGCLYVAEPETHLLVTKEGIKLGYGPKENRWRPSIDVLFRSAAATFNGRTIGIVLTGYLNDGTAGMLAIRKSGGTCIVQDPNEAEYPDMPISVLNHLKVDYCVGLGQMGAVLEEAMQTKKEDVEVPAEVMAEAAIAEKVAVGIEHVNPLGNRSFYSCPDCGGALFDLDQGQFKHFRCHTGHSYTQQDLLIKQQEQFESTLWVAMRYLEERKTLLRAMEEQNTRKGFQRSAADYREKVKELDVHIERIKQVLLSDLKEDGQ